jgi:hypothetical protein
MDATFLNLERIWKLKPQKWERIPFAILISRMERELAIKISRKDGWVAIIIAKHTLRKTS